MPVRFRILLLALLAALVPVAGLAQDPSPPDQGLSGTVEGTFAPIKLALPVAEADAASRTVAEEIRQTVWDDLEFSGFFDLVDPRLYNLVSTETRPGSVPHEEWRSIGSESLALMRVSVESGRISLTAWVYVHEGEELLFSRRYGGDMGIKRRIAHSLANDLILQFAGAQGQAMTRIAFVSRHGDKNSEIYLMDYDGRDIRRLTTSNTINLSPAWSPDAKRLSYVSWREKRPDIYIMDDTGQRTMVPAMKAELNTSPDWSPDGNRLVYTSDAPGNAELYVVDLKTRRNTRLTRNPGIDTSPAFSPNGREIAFTSDRSGNPQVYLMDSDGLNTRRISRSGSYNESPAWSPKGDKLAYVSRIRGQFEIVILELATGTLQQVTSGPGHKENPRWSPDGRYLVYSGNASGTYQIYTVQADGRNARQLTRGPASVTPDWR
jgi:TolB protein